MSQCDLHFGDPTAHATVKWFLKGLTVGGLTPSEDLCRELNVVRFIDCLRDQVENNKHNKYFKSIENTAIGLLKDENWKNRPHFSLLLFSMARNFLVNQPLEFVKETSLYCIAEKIYEHFKTQPNSDESRSHVFKTGFQLAYFQEDDKWHREYTKFKDSYYEELSELRLHYYSVNNPADFSQRVVERCKSISTISKEIEAWDQDFHVLNPLLLELPIFVQGSDALKFANKFVQNLEDEKNDIVNELSKEFRCIQWEILIRNLVEETKGKISFYPITDDRKISGIPEFPFLSKFIQDAREIEHDFIPSHGEIPKKHNGSPSTDGFLLNNDNLKSKVEECHKSFYTLLPEIPKRYSFVHKDLVDSFVNMRPDASKQRDSDNSSSAGNFSNAILIEDGEFSFFSLLWFLRYSVAQGEPPKDWGLKPNEKLPVCFRPNDDKSSDDWWDTDSGHNMYEFAEECGWIICLSESKCIPTRRWRSLLAWLRRLNTGLKEFYENKEPYEKLCHDDPLIQRLPVKRLDYEGKDEVSFIEKLCKFLGSSELKKNLDELDVFLPSHSMLCKDFAEKQLGCLIKSLVSLLDIESSASAGLEDVLLRCCRGFVPLEHLFRAYQPYQLHVLFLALNWEKPTSENQKLTPKLTPTAISGTTIVGRVEIDQNSMVDSENFLEWVTPYWSLFSNLSSQFTLPNVKKDSEQIGEQTQIKTFAHQTGRLLNVAWSDMRDKLNFRGQFALWLALTQVTKIWGRDDLDTIEEINKYFPGWGTGPSEIVDQLVNRGLWEGIVRGARPPESGKDNDPKWALTIYLEKLRGDPKDIIKEMRESLLFEFESPKGIGPPEWVRTVAFAICFYHGMRQAAYHALETFVIDDECKPNTWCLKVKWDSQSVSIYNRGRCDEEHFHEDFEANDRPFFELFEDRANEFCRKKGIDEVFKIDGPEPSKTSNTWQLVIKKHKLPPDAK